MGFSRFEKYTPIKYNDIPMFTPNFKKIEENMLMAQKQIDDFDATATAAIASIKSANGHSDVRDELVAKLSEDKDRIIQAYLSNPLEGGKLLKNFKNDINKDASSGLIYNLSLGYQDEQAKANAIKDYYKDPAVRDMELSKLYSKYTPDTLFAGNGKYNPASDYKMRTFLNEKERNDRLKSFRDEAEADSWERYVQLHKSLLDKGAYTLESLKEQWKGLELPKVLEMATLSFMSSPEMKSTYDMLGEAYYGVEGQGDLNYEEVPLVYQKDEPMLDANGNKIKDDKGNEIYHKAGEPIVNEKGEQLTKSVLRPDTLAAKALLGSAKEKVYSEQSFERETTAMDAQKSVDEYRQQIDLQARKAALELANAKEIEMFKKQLNEVPSDITTYTGDTKIDGYVIERTSEDIMNDIDNTTIELAATKQKLADVQNNPNLSSTVKNTEIDRLKLEVKEQEDKLVNLNEEKKKIQYSGRANDMLQGFNNNAKTVQQNTSVGNKSRFGTGDGGIKYVLPASLQSEQRQRILKIALVNSKSADDLVSKFKTHLGSEFNSELEAALRKGWEGAKLKEREGLKKAGVQNTIKSNSVEHYISGLQIDPYHFKNKNAVYYDINGNKLENSTDFWQYSKGNDGEVVTSTPADLDVDVATEVAEGGDYIVKITNLKSGAVMKTKINKTSAPQSYEYINHSINKAVNGYMTSSKTGEQLNSKGYTTTSEANMVAGSPIAADFQRHAKVNDFTKAHNVNIAQLNDRDKVSMERIQLSKSNEFANLMGVQTNISNDNIYVHASRGYTDKGTATINYYFTRNNGKTLHVQGIDLTNALKTAMVKTANVQEFLK